ncbi:tyrosine-type recombinase/integrase [Sorangium cellulosum]|uniref:tyrosine-type recombinase/integrase n=1 Tax=Sorangium cellulosum TaxID=56 RepID=UPI0013319F06|nr:tyrosine-type recombinase/integrase [Sorangium cellulosum]
MPKQVTLQQFGELWTSGELARMVPDHVKPKRSVEQDVYRFDRHIYPIAGRVPIASFTLDDAERVMRALPSMSPASRCHIAQLLHRLMAMAVFPCRLLAANPLPRGFLPKLGSAKVKACLYPDEDARLLACTAIQLCWRVLWGFLNREGPRISEAARLQVQDVDLNRGALRLEKIKTNDPRAWALSPGVPQALRAWLALRGTPAPSAPLFINEEGERFSVEHAAERFRAHLQLAGIDRPELFEDSDERQQVRAHDTRSTFITVALANSRSETWVADRTGHRSSIVIQRYRRAARTFAELGLGELASLAEAVPKLGGNVTGNGTEEGEGGTARRKLLINSNTWPRAEMADAVDLKGGLGRGKRGEAGELPGKSDGGGDGSRRLERGCDDSEGARDDSIGGSGAGGERVGEGVGARGASVRAMLLVQLGEGLAAAIVAGDVESARVAHEAIGRLLGGPTPPQGEVAADVLDLARERERRGR